MNDAYKECLTNAVCKEKVWVNESELLNTLIQHRQVGYSGLKREQQKEIDAKIAYIVTISNLDDTDPTKEYQMFQFKKEFYTETIP